jgi:hypothetical protein
VFNRSKVPIGTTPAASIKPDSSYTWTFLYHGQQVTEPQWLETPRTGDIFSAPTIRVPEGTWNQLRSFTLKYWIGGPNDAWTKTVPIVYRYVDPVRGQVERPIAVAPAVSITLDNVSELARARSELSRFYNVTLRSALMKPASIRVNLTLPSGLLADSAARTVTLDSAATRTVTFRVHGKLNPGIHTVKATATLNGQTYSRGYIPIEYEHISPERIYRNAEVAIHAIDINVPSRLSVAYIRGVGDNVEPPLEQLGIPVTVVEPRAIPTVDLSKFSTVVVGPRAYQASRELIDNNVYLLNFAKSGGTLVVQYGQYEMMQPGMMPYQIAINRPHDRVTEENAPIHVIDASSAVFKTPNTINAADFSAWVQERSLYMPRTFDAHYRPLVELNDPGEQPNKGGILVTPYGRGMYVYTTLAFFRQLPESGGLHGCS